MEDDDSRPRKQARRNMLTGKEMEDGPSATMDASDPSEETLELITSGSGKHNIFVSHSGAEKAFAEQLCEDLRSANHSPFFDQWSDCLPKGERFASNILQACAQCSMAVIILSPKYVKSKWPMIELNAFVRAQSSENPRLKLFPVFYKLRPEDLKSAGKISEWEVEWLKYGEEDDRIHVEEWRDAVKRVSSFNGLEFGNIRVWEHQFFQWVLRRWEHQSCSTGEPS